MPDEIFNADSRLVACVKPSPNHGERRGTGRPDHLVLHYTGMASCEAAVALLRDPGSQVSAHYVIDEAGVVLQLVPESRRAWHAGASQWKSERDLNSASIGIEIANPGHGGGSPPYPAAQIAAVVELCRDIGSRWRIRPERVLAHSDIAPSRKRDPGEFFPWDRLAASGVGHWVTPQPLEGGPMFALAEQAPSIRGLQAMLALYGYGIELTGVYDKPTQTVVAAFQRHFRPRRVDGMTDASTVGTLKTLIDRLSG